MLKESLDQGNIEEIKLTKGVLILQRNQQSNIACILVATRSSRTLKEALIRFTERFCQEYGQFFSEKSDIMRFAPAGKLVAECFPFVPEYD